MSQLLDPKWAFGSDHLHLAKRDHQMNPMRLKLCITAHEEICERVDFVWGHWFRYIGI